MKTVWCEGNFEQGCPWVALTGNGPVFCVSVKWSNNNTQPSLSQRMVSGLQAIPKPLGERETLFCPIFKANVSVLASCLHLMMNSSPGISPEEFTIPCSLFSSQLYPGLSANQTNWSCINPITYLFSIRWVVGSLWQMKGNLRLLPFELQKFGNVPHTLKWHE